MGNNNEDKLRALDAALGQIEKQYGKGAVMKIGDSAAKMKVEKLNFIDKSGTEKTYFDTFFSNFLLKRG